jgi:hypothetical protein
MRSRKEQNLDTQVTDASPKPHVKKQRQKKNEKKGSTDNLSPRRNLEISPGHIVTSVATRQVDRDIPTSSSTPEDKVTRAAKAEVELPSRNKKTLKSKGNTETEESAAKKDTDLLADSSISVRKTRNRQWLPSAAEICSSPRRRKQVAAASADAEVSSSPTQKQGVTATAKVKSPIPSKNLQGNTAVVIVEKLPLRKRRGGTASTVSEHPSSPKRLRVTVTEDSGDAASSPAVTAGRRQGAAVSAEVGIVNLPVIKKTRGKLAVRFAASPTASVMPREDLNLASNKQPAKIDCPSPAGTRRQRGTKPVEPTSPVPPRKLRSKNLPGEIL